jgi:D-beta-D-heptose 7-phosphate kinase/D-beta-D-heptose 1-phosphate adenosyltransferase
MSGRPRRSDEKLTDLDRLVEWVTECREDGRRIVFTNGVFDLLHTGHLKLLESAAGLGDRLVVGINRDDSVRQLKGPERPLVPFEQRAALVAGLEVVDRVIGFAETTPLELIDAIVPDVLAKGGDWPVERIVGREIVERHGGRVVSLPLVPGRSTTGIVERLRSISSETRPTLEE